VGEGLFFELKVEIEIEINADSAVMWARGLSMALTPTAIIGPPKPTS